MKTARLFRKEGRKMGDTNSMLYAIGAFILIYLIAMGIYQLVLWIRKKTEKPIEQTADYRYSVRIFKVITEIFSQNVKEEIKE